MAGPRANTSKQQGKGVLTLIQRARRRLFHNELLSQGSYAAAAILTAFIVLLVAGTGLLDWHWMALVAVPAVAIAVYRARKRLLSVYGAAQVVDRRLALADTISTAIYFQREPMPAEDRRFENSSWSAPARSRHRWICGAPFRT